MELKNRIFAYVFDWLCQNEGVDGQKDLSRRTKISENTLTNILNGKTKVSDKTLHKLNMGFNGMFNMQYLRGIDPFHMLVDDLLNDTAISRVPYNDEKEKAANPPYDEKAARDNLIEILARTIRGVDDLRVQLQQELAEVRALKEELRQLTHRPVVYMNNEQKYVSAAEPDKQ